MGRTFKDSKKYYKGDSKRPKFNPKDKNRKDKQWQKDERDRDWKQYENR